MSCRDLRTLQQVKLRLNQWRARNGAPTPIPGQIWAKAVQLARQYGVGHVARALRLDHGALKRRVDGYTPASPARLAPEGAPTTFIELLPAPPPQVIGRCVVEVKSARGDRLRLKLSAIPASALGTLVKEMLA